MRWSLVLRLMRRLGREESEEEEVVRDL